MIKVPFLRHQRYISPSPLTPRVKTTECTRKKNVDFDTFDVHVMVNYIEPNLQEIIFGPIREGLITQKQILGPLKKMTFLGPDPLIMYSSPTKNLEN